MTKKFDIPRRVYALIVLVGPVLFLSVMWLAAKALSLLFGLLGRFDYWWVVAAVAAYLLLGGALAGWASTLEGNTDE
jgi:Na+/proline symporter